MFHSKAPALYTFCCSPPVWQSYPGQFHFWAAWFAFILVAIALLQPNDVYRRTLRAILRWPVKLVGLGLLLACAAPIVLVALLVPGVMSTHSNEVVNLLTFRRMLSGSLHDAQINPVLLIELVVLAGIFLCLQIRSRPS